MYTHQFNNEALRLCLAALSSGTLQTDQLIQGPFQKFILRELRIGEAAIKGAVNYSASTRRFGFPTSGRSTDPNDDEDDEEASNSEQQEGKENVDAPPTKSNPIRVALYGQSCTAAKSYQSAICTYNAADILSIFD